MNVSEFGLWITTGSEGYNSILCLSSTVLLSSVETWTKCRRLMVSVPLSKDRQGPATLYFWGFLELFRGFNTRLLAVSGVDL